MSSTCDDVSLSTPHEPRLLRLDGRDPCSLRSQGTPWESILQDHWNAEDIVSAFGIIGAAGIPRYPLVVANYLRFVGPGAEGGPRVKSFPMVAP
jgi:hypothetical protein